MASIIENYKKYNAEWRIFDIFPLIDNDNLTRIENLFIEITLFLEMYYYTNGLTFTDESKEFFLDLFKRVNKTLAKKDLPEIREEQCQLLLKIYTRHYNALITYRDKLLIPYMLIAYINRIDLSFKQVYIDKIFNGRVKNFNNYKFKDTLFNKSMNSLIEFWDALEEQLDFEKASVDNKYEMIKTIILIQAERGYTKGDYYE